LPEWKESTTSIQISVTGAVIWLKTNFGLAILTLKIVPFHSYALFPGILPYLKRIPEVVFCESVQHHLQFCLDHLSCVNMAVSSIRET
jgi:hypothetical protein